jgi:poly-gamma-glutamate capsule biosynthesis protein CapA/YwtB (metallophosphatase superfamily)
MRARVGAALSAAALVAALCASPRATPAAADPPPVAVQPTPAPPPVEPSPSPDPVPAADDVRRPRDEVRAREVTLAFTGDLLPHLPVVRAAGGDFRPLFAAVAPLLSEADLALCHLEVPLSRDGTDVAGYPLFNAPPELAVAIPASGWDGCSTASNHSIDQGPEGVRATLDVLDAAGVPAVGTARDQAEDDRVRLYRAGGVTVAHLSATYGLNGLSMPADQPWLVDLIDPPAILAEAGAARAAGADVVVLSLHWGQEYRTAPTDDQRALAAQLLASPDVDLIVGHHAHVIQPIEWIGDEPVLFGLGNFLSGQNGAFHPGTQDGVVAHVTVEVAHRARVTAVTFTPTWVEPGSYRVLPAPADSSARTATAIGPGATPRG